MIPLIKMVNRKYLINIITYCRKILLENKYLSPIQNKINTKQEITTRVIFDNTLILKGLSNIYTKDLLQKIKLDIIAQYEDEVIKLKLLLESVKEKHSTTHRTVLRNTEKLLNNLNLVNTAIDNISETQNDIITHLKEMFMLEQIEHINFTSKRND